MVKVRVTDLRFVALALLLLASPTTGKPVKNTNRSWHNPCDVASTVKTRRQAPLESHLKTIRPLPLVTQLKNTRDGFCDEWVKVAPMYNSIEAMKKKFHNIPDDKLIWHKAKTVDHEKKNNETLHRLHVNLQHFLIGLESMKLTDGLLIQDNKIRDKFFHKISREAKLLLCEVETFVNISNVPKPEPQPEYDPCLDELDHGTAVLLGCEKSFFKLYSSFLHEVTAAFDKNPKRKPKMCAKHRQRKGTKNNGRPKNRDASKRRHENSRTGPGQSQP